MLKIYLARYLLDLNRFLANNINKSLYFFFVKYIYPICLLKKIDFSLKFRFDNKKKIIEIKSSKSKRGFYYNLERSNRYIFGGFDGIGKKLSKKYLLDEIKINKKDIIIEIGSNIGELTRYLSKYNPKIYAIDIEQKALDCLILNCKNHKNIKVKKIAIWNKKGLLDFNSKLNEASSSLLKPRQNDKEINIQKINAITLDKFFLENKINRLKLLKVEAEGGEPEILQGALKVLKKVEYISLDCGPERYGKTTMKEVTKVLKKNKFQIKTYKNCCLGINKELISKHVY
tara:strand:+ start:1739 stop:2599 length:861 start_codon:yes stop_codon:yes gene_type:complete